MGSITWNGVVGAGHPEGLLAQGVAPRWDTGPTMLLLVQNPQHVARWPQLVRGSKLKGQVHPLGTHIAPSPLHEHNS